MHGRAVCPQFGLSMPRFQVSTGSTTEGPACPSVRSPRPGARKAPARESSLPARPAVDWLDRIQKQARLLLCKLCSHHGSTGAARPAPAHLHTRQKDAPGRLNLRRSRSLAVLILPPPPATLCLTVLPCKAL